MPTTQRPSVPYALRAIVEEHTNRAHILASSSAVLAPRVLSEIPHTEVPVFLGRVKDDLCRRISALLSNMLREQDIFSERNITQGRVIEARAYVMDEQKFIDIMILVYQDGMREGARQSTTMRY